MFYVKASKISKQKEETKFGLMCNYVASTYMRSVVIVTQHPYCSGRFSDGQQSEKQASEQTELKQILRI